MSNDRDHVAVVTRTRNRPVLLARAIDSVLAQTHRDWVHVVVNDGGDPAPVAALIARQDATYGGRVIVLNNPAPLGMEAASNAGIAAVGSRWVAIHDDDDTWRPAFLDRTLAAIRAHPLPECRGAVAWSEQVIERIDGARIIELGRESYGGRPRQLELWRLLQENQFPPIAFLFARSAYEAAGGFDATLPVLGDWDFNLRFCARFEIAVVPETLASIHHRPAGTHGAYANTVTAGAHLHAQYRVWLMNRWLRQDLAAGRIGPGVLAALAGELHGAAQIRRLPRRAMRLLRRRLTQTGAWRLLRDRTWPLRGG